MRAGRVPPTRPAFAGFPDSRTVSSSLVASLTERALDVNAANLALGNDVYELTGATFVRNTALPNIYDANHIRDATASTPHDIDALLAAADREYAASSHRRFTADHRTPPELLARLTLDGYSRSEGLVLLLEGELRTQPKPFDIRPLVTERDWEEYWTLSLEDWVEGMAKRNHPEEAQEPVARQMWAARRRKQPPTQYWMAYVDGRPIAYFNSWAGTDGVGQVEDLFTRRPFRHRGAATALIHHCVTDARAKGAGPVVIVADPTDTPMHMYAAMGFRPVALTVNYLKKLDPA